MRLFVTGYVLGPHGLDGTFKVKSASGESGHITRLKRAVLRKDGEDKAVDVVKAEAAQGCVLMKVKGIDTPEAAKAFAGSEVVVTENEAHKCSKGEWYVDDLCGCCVMYGKDRVGKVTDVTEGGVASLVEVVIDGECALLEEGVRRTAKGKARRVMVPFTDEHIGEVDTEKKQMQLRHLWVLE